MPQITVKVKKDGSATLECDGFVGEACNITKVAEAALGIVQNEQDKPERYLQALDESAFNTTGN